jgi:hypothetical protein
LQRRRLTVVAEGGGRRLATTAAAEACDDGGGRLATTPADVAVARGRLATLDSWTDTCWLAERDLGHATVAV